MRVHMEPKQQCPFLSLVLRHSYTFLNAGALTVLPISPTLDLNLCMPTIPIYTFAKLPQTDRICMPFLIPRTPSHATNNLPTQRDRRQWECLHFQQPTKQQATSQPHHTTVRTCGARHSHAAKANTQSTVSTVGSCYGAGQCFTRQPGKDVVVVVRRWVVKCGTAVLTVLQKSWEECLINYGVDPGSTRIGGRRGIGRVSGWVGGVCG